jgi:predicted ATPase/DNA-binding SARP family transcriptional activator
MRFGILGPFEVIDDRGRELSLGGPKQRAVLALLLLHADEVISSDRLIDELWGERAPRTAAKAIRVYVSNLRKALGEGWLATRGHGYVLKLDGAELDADRFGELAVDGRRELDTGNPEAALEALRQALALWRGRPLTEFAYEPFAQNEIARLEEARLAALEDRVDAELALGQDAGLVAELEVLVREHPLRERLHGQLMLALYRAGRQADALESYRRARTHLADELGLEPSHALKQLQAQILEHAPALDLAGTPGGRPARRVLRPFAPEGTIALLVTDIEGSTELASRLGESWPALLRDHHALVGEAIAKEGGFVQSSDAAFFATFTDAQAAARAAVAAMRGLRAHSWPEAVGELKVRMGLHVGHVQRGETGYVGLEIQRAARVADAAHGGQLLVTAAAKELIGDELDTEPLGAHRLKDFPTPDLLFCAVIDGRGAAFFPPPRTQRIRPTNLPAGLPPLVGRELELERVRGAFLADKERIVTLTGRGGVGKTSLGLTAAASLLDEHPGGVWLVRLATVSVPDDVLPAIAGVAAAEASSDDSPLDAICGRLSGRGPTLLVLDNFEHLLPGARSVADLIECAPEVRVLVTSQAPLRLTGERCLTVDALDEDAALLLIERVARRRDPSFTIPDQDRAALGEIVSMLDGLPLALELAAARLGVLTAAQLRDRLRTSIDLLRDDVRDRSDRQRSLRATVEWTLESLATPARELFVRVGAFAGPVELNELETVAGADGLDVLDAVSGLLEVALLRRVEAGDGRVTFGLPEAARQIAAAMLDSAPEGERWRREHAQHQLELQWAARTMLGPRAVHDAAMAADAEAAAALRWAQDVGDPVAAPLAAARAGLLAGTGRILEALPILEPLLDSPPADPEVYGQALVVHSAILEMRGQPEEALVPAGRAVELLTGEALVLALINRSFKHMALGDIENALTDNERATALARDLGPDALSTALMFEGQTRMDAGELDLAAALGDEADRLGADPMYSRHVFEGDLALLRHQALEAAHHFTLSLELEQQRGNLMQVFNDLIGLADALAMKRDDLEALEVSGIAEALISDLGGSVQAAWHPEGRDLLFEAEERVGAEAAAEARERGRHVGAGYRVTRACELARHVQPVEL